jgi:hypothetical protein
MKVHKVTYLTYLPTFIFHNYDYSTNYYYTFITKKISVLAMLLFWVYPCLYPVSLLYSSSFVIISILLWQFSFSMQ